MKRLLIIANRLPFSINKRGGEFVFRPSPGGLAVGLSSLPETIERLWIGWPGLENERLSNEDKKHITEELNTERCMPVFLSKRQIEHYYLGFCNNTIWPLFHYFPTRTIWEDCYWQAYKQVNSVFCREILKIIKPGDYIWIHDYQLMLLPQLLRKELPSMEIGFFLHIPWPSFELFRLLPWREEILSGLLGADLIGFHTYDYVRHFLSSVCRIMGLEHMLGKIHIDRRIIKVDAFPLGINYKKYSEAVKTPEIKKEKDKILQHVRKRKIIISIDRLDYTKGIIQRLEAFDLFLSEYPQYKEKVTLIMVAVPSRTSIEDYKTIRYRLEQLVGRVNGEHGSIGYVPVWYLYRFMPFNQISALYSAADVALVTPLRDGMNLIAKEFIASKIDGTGVLILSEMTGAASELGEALIVNSNNKADIVQAIKQALEMPKDEQIERNRLMQARLVRYNVSRWSNDFLHVLSEIKKTQNELAVHKLSDTEKQNIIDVYKERKTRLLLLDYDGTLVGFKSKPAQAGPDEELLSLIYNLSNDTKNKIVIISGRDRETLDKWFGQLEISFVAEHGAWIKNKTKEWLCTHHLGTEWKSTIKPILEVYCDRTPGSSIEEKSFSLVWHYRRAAPELAYIREQELRNTLLNLTENLGIGVFEGNKILEIKPVDINKGRAADYFISDKFYQFILAAGDDYTDEEMFDTLPDEAYSIKIGQGISRAKFRVDTISEMRMLLKELARN
ncbi:MAG: bifunctional alpha,alpha-trehalose-phosphate synthase (UDP-forming)/trehalose-phosphatase [Sedimentisphaerales bacterium]|nr:bifunctional alpha,alpha-trehalose-phosphate synthase (UDP-forming)/trehalose-phosphatase [Sedimentisphaerales bacterium]